MLQFKTIYGDILVFKNNNDCMTIFRNSQGQISINTIEINGEKLEAKECNYKLLSHPLNTFTQEEADFFINNYEELNQY